MWIHLNIFNSNLQFQDYWVLPNLFYITFMFFLLQWESWFWRSWGMMEWEYFMITHSSHFTCTTKLEGKCQYSHCQLWLLKTVYCIGILTLSSLDLSQWFKFRRMMLGFECLCASHPHPQVICWNSNPQGDGIRKWGLWEVINLWGQSPHEWN